MRHTHLCLVAATVAACLHATTAQASISVGAEFVIALDDSGSVDPPTGQPSPDGLAFQFNAMIDYFSDPGNVALIQSVGGIAVGVVRYGEQFPSLFGPPPSPELDTDLGSGVDTGLVTDLFHVDDTASANAFVNTLTLERDRLSPNDADRFVGQTSPQLGIRSGTATLTGDTGFESENQFINLFANSPQQDSFANFDQNGNRVILNDTNPNADFVTDARDDAEAEGITINGVYFTDPVGNRQTTFTQESITSDGFVEAAAFDEQAISDAFEAKMDTELLAIVPEPAHVAAVFGLVALVLGGLRRRLRA